MFDRRVEIVARWRDLSQERWRAERDGGPPMPHRVVDAHGKVLFVTHRQSLARVVASAPEDMAYLLEELERLRRENDALRAELGKETLVGKSREGDITLATFKIHDPADDG